MISIIKINNFVNEQTKYKGHSITKPLMDAIKNRYTVTFYYSGPAKPKQRSVKRGTRYDAEVVALGLNKKGNMVIRAYVKPPSTSKRGFSKHGWRTFMVSRMSRIVVNSDNVWNEKRPFYKEGDDGSMTVTYASTDWNNIPKVKKSKKLVSPIIQKTTEPLSNIPKDTKPEIEPTNIAEPKVNDLPEPINTVKPDTEPIPTGEPEESGIEEPDTEESNTDEPDTEESEDLPEPNKKKKPNINPETIEENIKQIKRLILLLK
jgi:hypothetical protein